LRGVITIELGRERVAELVKSQRKPVLEGIAQSDHPPEVESSVAPFTELRAELRGQYTHAIGDISQ
jgi:ornithine carbamoyltransferase